MTILNDDQEGFMVRSLHLGLLVDQHKPMNEGGRRRKQIEAQRHHATRTGLTLQAPQRENGAEVV